MKKLMVLMLFAVPLMAQQDISRFADSTGTATVYWQKVDLLNSSLKQVEVLNDGSVNLSFALAYQDTVLANSTNNKYRKTIKPSESLRFRTQQRYVYVKAASTTCAYRIGTF